MLIFCMRFMLFSCKGNDGGGGTTAVTAGCMFVLEEETTGVVLGCVEIGVECVDDISCVFPCNSAEYKRF